MPYLNHPDAFTAAELTSAIKYLPTPPLMLQSLFEEQGITTAVAAIDIRKDRLVLVADSPRGSAPDQMGGRAYSRQTKYISTNHLAIGDVLSPEDIQDRRAFGLDEPENPASVVNDKLQALKSSINATLEWHRLGAIKGKVLDADGKTELHDIFKTFGVEQKQQTIKFPGTAGDDSNPVMNGLLACKRHVSAVMGGNPYNRIECLLGANAYDMLTGHALVRRYFEDWLAHRPDFGDNDYRKRGFTYAGITFFEASDVVGGLQLVAEDKGYLYPVGPGIFKTLYAPADWMETVNTRGLPLYARMDEKQRGRGYDLEAQSNPLCLCMFPGALQELTFQADPAGGASINFDLGQATGTLDIAHGGTGATEKDAAWTALGGGKIGKKDQIDLASEDVTGKLPTDKGGASEAV